MAQKRDWPRNDRLWWLPCGVGRPCVRWRAASAWDVRRFRPTILIETVASVEGLVEAQWSGRILRLGMLSVRCEIPTARCGVTTQAQMDLPKDSTVLRTIVRDAAQNLGMYASVIAPGDVAVGNMVELRYADRQNHPLLRNRRGVSRRQR